MKELNLPPFYIGQKIIRIGATVTSKLGIATVIKGHVYTCAGCYRCECGLWLVLIAELPTIPGKSTCKCLNCTKSIGSLPCYTGYSTSFVPVEENFQSISYEKVLENEKQFISAN